MLNRYFTLSTNLGASNYSLTLCLNYSDVKQPRLMKICFAYAAGPAARGPARTAAPAAVRPLTWYAPTNRPSFPIGLSDRWITSVGRIPGRSWRPLDLHHYQDSTGGAGLIPAQPGMDGFAAGGSGRGECRSCFYTNRSLPPLRARRLKRHVLRQLASSGHEIILASFVRRKKKSFYRRCTGLLPGSSRTHPSFAGGWDELAA
jgi:hypothetical protein